MGGPESSLLACTRIAIVRYRTSFREGGASYFFNKEQQTCVAFNRLRTTRTTGHAMPAQRSREEDKMLERGQRASSRVISPSFFFLFLTLLVACAVAQPTSAPPR